MKVKKLKINKLKCDYLLKRIVSSDPILNKEDITINIDKLNIGSSYKPYLKEFIKNTKDDFNFRNPNEKLRTLKINHYKESVYLIKYNKIKLCKRKDIYHELFHALTSFNRDSNQSFSGFNQYSMFYNVGTLFDEGYTDLSTKRYFNEEILYMIEANIARKTEIILGEKTMRDFYTSNNLYAIIKFLSRFSSEEEAIAFISSIDKLSIYRNNIKRSIQIMNILSNYLVDVYLNFLVKIYSQGKFGKADINIFLSIFKEEFTKYAFYNDDVEKEYLKSSDYLDITSKLSNSNFREELRKKVLTK